MKKFFIIAAFFWACTFTQQAQYTSSSYPHRSEESGLNQSNNFQIHLTETRMLIAENDLNKQNTNFSQKIKTF